jgi:hypothetical protein
MKKIKKIQELLEKESERIKKSKKGKIEINFSDSHVSISITTFEDAKIE